MIISSNETGDITADAIDLDTSANGEHQVLSVSLKSLDEDTREYEIPDFELEHNDGPPSGLYDRTASVREKQTKKSPILALVIIGIILVLAIAALWFFFLGGKEMISPRRRSWPATEQNTPATPPPVRNNPPASQTAQPPAPPPAAPPPVIQAPAAPQPSRQTTGPRNRPPAPVSSYKVPATIPREGAPYKIRWGDTLWDISEAFYRDPWQYPRIARFNNIRNPDLIISGTTIRIPPRN
jgi:LysM repeat protein